MESLVAGLSRIGARRAPIRATLAIGATLFEHTQPSKPAGWEAALAVGAKQPPTDLTPPDPPLNGVCDFARAAGAPPAPQIPAVPLPPWR